MTNDLAIIPCPPLSVYPEQPKDMSKCEDVNCPKCNQKMWLSAKKKILNESLLFLGKEVLLACYDCIMKIALENKKEFGSANLHRIDI